MAEEEGEEAKSCSAPSPLMLSVESRFLGVELERKGCVEKVMRRAEW